MLKYLILFLIIPALSFANEYEPFSNVGSSGNNILLSFSDSGIRYSAIYKDKNFITTYGQNLNIHIGDTLVLNEKHTKYIITAESKRLLLVQRIHTWQGNTKQDSYEIHIK